jgi:hypothetical protein
VEGVIVEIGVGRVVCVELILYIGYILYGGVDVVYVVVCILWGAGYVPC